jgi:hypothetical protein
MSKLGYWERRCRVTAPSHELGAAVPIENLEEFGGKAGEINPPPGDTCISCKRSEGEECCGSVVCVRVLCLIFWAVWVILDVLIINTKD